MALETILQQLEQLSAAELRVVEQTAARLRSQQREDLHNDAVAATRTVGAITYRLEYVRCGKAQCACVGGTGHGPYWYAYWWEGGRTRKRYIGKYLSEERVTNDE